LQASGKKVAVVGDGINDAAAMAHADVAISLGSGSALAREAADVVLMSDDLRDLIHAIEIARHALNIIRQNQAFVVGTNSAGIAYGVLAVLNPIAGVILNNGVAFAAALNSLRTPHAPAGATKPQEKQESPTQ
jgi:P-type E1-E2 ATPase